MLSSLPVGHISWWRFWGKSNVCFEEFSWKTRLNSYLSELFGMWYFMKMPQSRYCYFWFINHDSFKEKNLTINNHFLSLSIEQVEFNDELEIFLCKNVPLLLETSLHSWENWKARPLFARSLGCNTWS